jgi:hypothetical protein
VKIVESYWSKPISVRLQDGLDHTFHTIQDTLDFLENEWPMPTGPHRSRAIDICRAALDRITPTEVAREAVISACIEAGMTLSNFPICIGPQRGSVRAVWGCGQS